MTSTILINGEPSPGIVPVTDSSVLRGDGCFEVLRSYDGVAFALEEHLERLMDSARALDMTLPDPGRVKSWVEQVAAECGDCAIRIVATRGSAVPGTDGSPLVIVFGHPPGAPQGPVTLLPVTAPWHAGGVDWDLAGAKTLSYAPNLAATRRAIAGGFDDALLVNREGIMLEGPTFSVAWVVDGVLETPGLALGILGSITRRVVLEDARALGLTLVEGAWSLDRLAQATEMMALSTIREVQPVSRVGDVRLPEGPVTADLARAFAQRLA